MCKTTERSARKHDYGRVGITGTEAKTGSAVCDDGSRNNQNEQLVSDEQLELLIRPLRDINSRHLPSRGSALHPDGCTACRFHCHSFDVPCNKGWDCNFCHLIEEHPSNRGDKKMEMMAKVARRDPDIHTV